MFHKESKLANYLDGKVAIVTGAGRGIGAGVARGLASSLSSRWPELSRAKVSLLLQDDLDQLHL